MPAAAAEVVRVLRPRDTLVVIDVVAPEAALLDTTLQTIDLLRDMSHVRNYCASEWRSMKIESIACAARRAWLPLTIGRDLVAGNAGG